jgi:carbonic anhydrase
MADACLSTLPRVEAIDQLLANNEKFSSERPAAPTSAEPRLKVAVLACMDARIDVFSALGLASGEAHVLRNAGGTVTDDVIRSLAVSQRRLGTTDVMLISHTGCGMQTLDEREFSAELEQDAGVPPPFAIESLSDLDTHVRQSIVRVRESPFLVHPDRVRGFVYDLESHRLREV